MSEKRPASIGAPLCLLVAVTCSAACTPLRDDRAKEALPCDADCGCAPPADGRRIADATDVYVNPNVSLSGLGTSANCPFRTISEALARVSSLTVSRTIHLAPGVYDAASGEVFPLDLRGGISLVGEGEDRSKVKIVGAGPFDPNDSDIAEYADPGAGTYHATLFIGKGGPASRIHNLSLSPQGVPSTYGIVCNGAPVTTSDMPNGHDISEVSFGQDYRAGFVATSSVQSTASCKAVLTGNQFRLARFGMRIGGCPSPAHAGVNLRVGNGTAQGANVFHNLRSANNDFMGAGISADGCIETLTVDVNTFTESDQGIWLGASRPTVVARITGNDFRALTRLGVRLGAFTTVDELSKNQFRAISMLATQFDFPASGLLIGDDRAPDAAAALVRRARDNTFIGNDVGVDFQGAMVSVSDFGTMNSPGGNTFRCNSWKPSRTENWMSGADVALVWARGAAHQSFVGNVWDHDPPTTAVTPASDGTDILVGAVRPPSVDASDARVATTPCADARVP